MIRRLLSSLAVAATLSSLGALSLGCVEEVVVHEPRRHGAGVPFLGVYNKVAESTFQGGRRVRVANAQAATTVTVERGRVTYDQEYVAHGHVKRVSQLYTFGRHDVRQVGDGEYDVVLTFRGMGGDTQGYSADRHNPRLEVRATPSGWAVDLLTTDSNGVIGILECR